MSEDFIVDTDASDIGVIGVVLSQLIRGEEKVISFYSKGLSLSEKNYCSTRKVGVSERCQESLTLSVNKTLYCPN